MPDPVPPSTRPGRDAATGPGDPPDRSSPRPAEVPAAWSQRYIFLFWLPLAATWLMMAAEGPFVAAVIARLADPTYNLAAYGVTFAVALLVEAPVIMLMSASTALVADATSFQRLRRFAYALSVGTTALMLLLLVPWIFQRVMQGLIGLPREITSLTHRALWILLPWPGAIGYRRFYQGLLIRDGRTRLVALGTLVRLVAMAGTALALFLWIAPPGVYVAATALSVGVCAEAVASRWMAASSVRRVLAKSGSDPYAEPISSAAIFRFYYPLALTSLIGLAVQPMLTFFMGRAPSPIESLAVFPVVSALAFVFRSVGLAYQEVAIALMGKQHEHRRELRRFAVALGVATALGLALVGSTPLAGFWFGTVSGLEADLVRFSILPTMILIPIPFLSAILSYLRGVLMTAHVTRPITLATTIEVVGIAVGFPFLGWGLGVVGVTAASAAFLVGRTAGVAYLVPQAVRTVRRHGARTGEA